MADRQALFLGADEVIEQALVAVRAEGAKELGSYLTGCVQFWLEDQGERTAPGAEEKNGAE